MIENVGTALQTSATTGNGQTLVLPEPRLVTFKVQGNGPVSAGAVTLECCLQNTPVPPSSWSGERWSGHLLRRLPFLPMPRRITSQGSYGERFARGSARRNRYGPGHSARGARGLEPPPHVNSKGKGQRSFISILPPFKRRQG
jgi:hypothetical protein